LASYTLDFRPDYSPQDLILYFTSQYNEKQPFISVEWITPDGREIRVVNTALTRKQTYRFSQDAKLKTKLKAKEIIPALFSDPETGDLIKGEYQLRITGATFELIPISMWCFPWTSLRSGRDGSSAAMLYYRVRRRSGVWVDRFAQDISHDDGHCAVGRGTAGWIGSSAHHRISLPILCAFPLSG
jgi:hypothetical protein